MERDRLIAFIKQKLESAKTTLSAREEMEKVWRSGDDRSWAEAAAFHPDTWGKEIGKSERLEMADRHARIAERNRKEAEMFQATLDYLSRH